MIRTCIGCRERAEKTTLVRVVAVQAETTMVVTPDPDSNMPGRGAHVHPTVQCVELAIRRKAFGRALKIEGPIDLNALAALVPKPDPSTNH